MTNAELENVSVWMLHPQLSKAPTYDLPAGYTMRFYEEGDVETWVRIQQAADQFLVPTAETFAEALSDQSKLPQRVMFLVDPSGKDIGTITAWDDAQLMGRDIGQVHWVAIIPEAQGAGLAKPMLSSALQVLMQQGYRDAWLETGSARIPAINLYLSFGFQPYPRAESELAAWRSIAEKLKFPVKV